MRSCFSTPPNYLNLREKLMKAQSYLEGLEEALKFVPEESGPAQVKREAHSLRHGTDLAKVRQAILDEGKPMHISELLKAIGKEVNKKNRVSLAGNLASYVRDGKVFTRTAPATFGLLELPDDKAEPEHRADVSEDQEEQRPTLTVVPSLG